MNQPQAKALGDPTRSRIFEYLARADHQVDVQELTTEFGLNHNAIRQHLAKLVDAGLVIQTLAPARGRGRPRQLFEVDPTGGDWSGGGPFRRLSLLLIDMLRSGDSPETVGRRRGQAIPTTPIPPERAVEGLGRAIRNGGFDPHLVRDGEFVLRHCPFAEAAVADPDTVCALHLGLARGLADQFEGVVVDDLERRDPMRAGCRLRFHLENA
jgi:predicted ArsR family transcriptional regulator